MKPQDLMLNLMLSLVGSAYMLYGKKQGSPVSLLSGLLLVVEPYVVPGFLSQLVVGLALATLPFLRRG